LRQIQANGGHVADKMFSRQTPDIGFPMFEQVALLYIAYYQCFTTLLATN